MIIKTKKTISILIGNWWIMVYGYDQHVENNFRKRYINRRRFQIGPIVIRWGK